MPIAAFTRDEYGDLTPHFRGPLGRGLNKSYLANRGQTNRALLGEADLYRNALARAEYGGASREFGQGLGQIQNTLAGAGPLADSGAANALRAKLLSGVYGAAQSRIQGGYADYLKQLQMQRAQFNQQKELLKYQKKMQGGGGPLSSLASLAGAGIGFLAGGPPGAMAGQSAWQQTPWGS